MIHFIKEGQHKKIGLNLYRAAGGFVVAWTWFNFATLEGFSWRLRFRAHIKPRFLFSTQRWNVINDYLLCHGMVLVNQEILQDLKAVEDQQKRTNEPYAYIKPKVT